MPGTSGVGRSCAGRDRPVNEDAILVDDASGCYAVCDGAGGHAAGALASATCVIALEQTLLEQRPRLDAVADGAPPSQAMTVLDAAVQRATADIFALARAREDGASMASTFSALLFTGGRALVAHVGDTRIYRSRAGAIEQLTRDHTLLERYREIGVAPPGLTEAQMAQGLTRAVGVGESVDVDKLTLQVEPGDRYLLCSDGLSRYLEHRDDLSMLFEGHGAALPEALVDFALEAGGADDVSVVVVDV